MIDPNNKPPLIRAREHMAMIAERDGHPAAAEAFRLGAGDQREDLKEMLQAAIDGEI